MAAIIAGGGISKLEIFPDSSGLAYTYLPNSNGRAFVASAGYQGTALVGFLLLIFRRTKRGPRSGTMIIACTMILSCILWVRNTFGLVFILSMGLVFAGLALMLPSTHIRNLYTILAVTCSLNAIASIHDLFGSNYTVNGQQTETDAHTMADIKGGSYLMWAGLWLSLACVLTMMGIVLAIPGPDEVADLPAAASAKILDCSNCATILGSGGPDEFEAVVLTITAEKAIVLTTTKDYNVRE